MRNKHTVQIAFAGVSAGITLLFIWLANVVSVMSLTFYALSAVALMLPLCKKYYVAAVFAYIAAGLLSFFIVGNIFKVLPFVIFIGPFVVTSITMSLKNVKPYMEIPVKILFINAVLAVLYFALGVVLFSVDSYLYNLLNIKNLHYAWIAVIATMVLLFADAIMLRIFAVMQKTMDRVIKN
ncbi:MAG: hypothetical protein LBT55_01425 [Clostridiaceae bacterium]|jgi:hypothetical protein|nr:hypothetical protein [Clostridiaceae bacterium]